MNYQNNFWDNYFKYYDVLMNVIPYQELLTTIADACNHNEDISILDLGAGTGNIQYFLPATADVISLDQSLSALNRLKAKFPLAKIIQCSIIEPLPFENESFDRIIANNVLYTISMDQWEPIVSELFRVCKKGGIVVVSNLNTKFNPSCIYYDHIRKSLKEHGIFKTLYDLSRYLWPTIQMFRYNRTIKQSTQKSRYSFVTKDQQNVLFQNNGFMTKGRTQVVYSGQAYLDCFEKG